MNTDYKDIDGYVDDDEGQEYLLISDSFEEDEECEMFNLTPQENCQQTQINRHSTGASEKQFQDELWNALKATRKCLMFMVVIITVLLIISLIAVVLSAAAISYAIFESKKVRDTELTATSI